VRWLKLKWGFKVFKKANYGIHEFGKGSEIFRPASVKQKFHSLQIILSGQVQQSIRIHRKSLLLSMFLNQNQTWKFLFSNWNQAHSSNWSQHWMKLMWIHHGKLLGLIANLSHLGKILFTSIIFQLGSNWSHQIVQIEGVSITGLQIKTQIQTLLSNWNQLFDFKVNPKLKWFNENL